MTAGIYIHKPHSTETKIKIGASHKGKHYQTEESKRKIGNACRDEKSYIWKGNNATKNVIHRYIERRKPRPKNCEECGEERKLNLASLTEHNYTRNIEDYKWLCYSCHKKMDLKCNFCGKKEELHMCMACPDCYHKGFEIWKENFIRLLKECIRQEDIQFTDENFMWLEKRIDALAGDNLCK